MHCIFDLDGTLFESHQQIVNALTWTRFENKFTSLPEKDVRDLIGLPARKLFSDLNLDDESLHRVVMEFRERLKVEISIKNETYPEVKEILTELKHRGAWLSVATTKPTHLAEWTVNNSSLHGLFDHIQGTDNFEPKPSPEVINRCTSRFVSDEVYMFGDREEDMRAATSAKAKGIGVAQTIHDESSLIKAGAVYAFSEFRFIREIKELFPES